MPRVVLLRYYGASEAVGRPVTPLNLAITANVSKSGVSFRSLKPLGEAVRLKLVNESLWKSPREGVVRWCTQTAPGIYKVGVALF